MNPGQDKCVVIPQAVPPKSWCNTTLLPRVTKLIGVVGFMSAIRIIICEVTQRVPMFILSASRFMVGGGIESWTSTKKNNNASYS